MNKKIKEAAVKAIDDAQALIAAQRDILQGEYDDMSEKQQEGENGEALGLAIEQLEAASDAAEQALDGINNL